MAKKRLPRRKKLMLRYTLISLALILLAGGLIFKLQPRQRVYVPGDQVEGITRSLDRIIPSDYPRVVFNDVAERAGIHFTHFYGSRSTQLPEDMGSGAAWGDYDNDGNIDLYVCNIAGPLTMSDSERASSPAGNKLYRNNGDGTFSDVTDKAGVGFKGISLGAAWGDYNGDGYLDLVVTNFGANLLYRNNGDGTFTEVSQAAGLGAVRGFWTGASWADYDRDGNLDLYICGYVKYHFDPADAARSTLQYRATVPFTLNPSSYSPERNLLYHNNGNGTFTEVARQAGVNDPSGRSLSAAWCDFDNDGWPDLYVANDISDNKMFRNLGNGKFADVANSARVADYRGAMGLGIGDWDNDGDMDIFITHWIAQENALYSNLLFGPGGKSKSKGMLFIDVADQKGLGQIALDYIGWGTSFFDYDNDGRLDLFVANGSTFQDEKNPKKLVPMKNLLFWNKGEEDGFFEVGEVSGEVFRKLRVGRGAAFADYDNDGDIDIVVVNHSGPLLLLRNDGGNKNNWLKVRLQGGRKNRFGVGARIEVVAGGKRQIQEIGSQSSYLSQNPFEALFGMGKSSRVDQITVTFPGGKRQERHDLPVNQMVVIKEVE